MSVLLDLEGAAPNASASASTDRVEDIVIIDRKALVYSTTALALALGSLLNAHAQAPAAPPAGVAVNWAGFYVGAHVGSADASYDGIYDSSDLDEVPADSHIPAENLDDSGVAFGVYGGWNFQRGSLVAGVEADLSSIDIEKSALEPEDGSEEAIGSVDWLATVRGRVGVAVHQVLLFGTAGVAYVKGDYTVIDQGDGTGGVDFNQVGFVAGGGIEWAAWQRVSLRAEGLYYAFGDKVDTSRITGDADPDDFIELESSYVLRAGVTLRF